IEKSVNAEAKKLMMADNNPHKAFEKMHIQDIEQRFGDEQSIRAIPIELANIIRISFAIPTELEEMKKLCQTRHFQQSSIDSLDKWPSLKVDEKLEFGYCGSPLANFQKSSSSGRGITAI